MYSLSIDLSFDGFAVNILTKFPVVKLYGLPSTPRHKNVITEAIAQKSVSFSDFSEFSVAVLVMNIPKK
jgi:hypothetical protein